MSNEEERLISIAETCHIVGVSKAEIKRREDRGEFPSRIVDGSYRNSRRFFVLSEIREYVRQKIANSRRTPE